MSILPEARILELEARVAKLEAAILVHKRVDVSIQKKISAKEFLLSKVIKTDLHKTLLLGYYLERIEGMSSFNIVDLVSAYQAAKEPRPGNLSDTVGKNMTRGLFMAAPKKEGKKAWMLTTTGEKYVEEELKK